MNLKIKIILYDGKQDKSKGPYPDPKSIIQIHQVESVRGSTRMSLVVPFLFPTPGNPEGTQTLFKGFEFTPIIEVLK